MMSQDENDVLIIGGGIFGTSTAYHLSQSHPDPSKILLIDREAAPCSQAASWDFNKIVRADYTKPFYMTLAYEALDLWMNNLLYNPFYHNTGWIALDERGSDLSTRIRQNFKNSGRADTSSDRTLEDVKQSWGGVLSGIDTGNFDKAYFNSSAGWADASLAVRAMMESAVSKGVRQVNGEVEELVTDGKALSGVKTRDGQFFSGRQILLATGAWTSWLMADLETKFKVPPSMSIARQVTAAGVCVAAFELSESEATHYSQMPVLIYGAKGEVIPPNRDRMFKFTNASAFSNTIKHPNSGKSISVPDPHQGNIPSGLRKQCLEIIKQRMPEILRDTKNGGHREPDYWRICWDAVSPDQNQLICRHPDQRLSNLFFATAGSFHSWKFLPNIGKYVVNVLHGKSNGKEMDETWAWKTQWSDRGAHEKVLPKGELCDFER